MKRLDLIGVGAANVDLTVRVGALPRPDEEVKVGELSISGGGSAANVSVGASRLGLKVGFLGNVGKDYFGKLLLEEFRREGVDTSRVRVLEGMTGLALCLVNGAGERSILVYGGVNSNFSLANVDEEYVKEARAVFLSSVEGPKVLGAMEALCRIASQEGATIFFDPGCLFVEKGVGALKEILALSAVVKLNKVEAARLTGEKDMVKGAKKIRELGPKVVLITLGGEGCYVLAEGLETKIPTYPRFKPLDKTGAGDAFDAGFLAGFLRGWSVEESVKFGNLVASISITKVGARAVPTLNELKSYPEASEFRLEVNGGCPR